MEILQINNLSFKYSQADKNAIENIDLSINSGEFVVMCGESGCGKSTLLRMLKREVKPYGETSGSIIYNGVDLEKIEKRASASEIGLVLQNPETQIVTDYVWRELAFGLENLGVESNQIRRTVAEMSSYFGINDWYNKKTSELSGGQKQLLNLAAVMAMKPKVLLLDEPTAQLDPIAASGFISTLQKLNYELGLTVILIEHRLEEVLPLADRVIIMDAGKITFNGAPNKLTSMFEQEPEHSMLCAMPSAMRIFTALEGKGKAPITVREGREYVLANYPNNIKELLKVERSKDKNEITVEVRNAWYRYSRESKDIIKDMSLEVFKGEHFCILGGNGSGKTTALGLIAGLNKAYRGNVFINGKKVDSYKGNSLYINGLTLLSQNPQDVFVEMTVREDLNEICKVMKYSRSESEDKINEITNMLSISHLLDSHPYDLSGGEQQKAALAKVLLTNPSILLLDEPTKGIDVNAKKVIAEIIKSLCEKGVTVITVTHDIEFAAETGERCAMLFEGDIVSVDEPENFFAENRFYTTSANRIADGHFKNAILCEQVIELCRLNSKGGIQK